MHNRVISVLFNIFKHNSFLNNIVAIKNPIAVVDDKKILILVNGLHTLITAKILVNPII